MTLPAIIEPEDPRYPIGQLALPKTLTPQARQAAIDELAAFPQQLTAAIADLTEAQLDTPYRRPIDGEEVWTIRQLVHHLADSHATAYCWMRLALTNPLSPNPGPPSTPTTPPPLLNWKTPISPPKSHSNSWKPSTNAGPRPSNPSPAKTGKPAATSTPKPAPAPSNKR